MEANHSRGGCKCNLCKINAKKEKQQGIVKIPLLVEDVEGFFFFFYCTAKII